MNQANNNLSQCDSKDLNSDDNYDTDYDKPPPHKKQKSCFKSVLTARRDESDNDNDHNDNDENDDDIDDADEYNDDDGDKDDHD
jgi:hypothetical protein